MKFLKCTEITLMGLVVLMLAGFSLLSAQQQPPQQRTASFSDAQIDAFANAYLDVMEVQAKYKPQIESTQNPEEAQQLQQKANQEMVSVIEDQDGIELDEYNEVLQATRTDDQLRARVVQAVDKTREERENENR